eukprot:SAG22_NODE_80_length_21788_cov_9.742542_7_plen_441_part_00
MHRVTLHHARGRPGHRGAIRPSATPAGGCPPPRGCCRAASMLLVALVCAVSHGCPRRVGGDADGAAAAETLGRRAMTSQPGGGTTAATADGGTQPPPPPPLRMVVPLYMEPGPTWRRLAGSARAHPAVGITAIISPRHEDNAAPMAGDDIYAIARNRTWLDGMAELRGAGVALQHYYHMRNLTCAGIVHSGCAQSSCCLLPGGAGRVVNKHRCCNSWANVSGIVDAALHFWPQDGFFNDNGPMSQPAPDSPLATRDDIRTFEARVFNRTQSGGKTTRPVTMNGDHLDTFDAWSMASFGAATMMYESPGPAGCAKQPFRECFKEIPPTARALYAPTRFAALAVGLRNGSEMRRWVDGFMHAGYGTLCLLGTEQPEYTALPAFWEEEVEYLANKSLAITAAAAAARNLPQSGRHEARNGPARPTGEPRVGVQTTSWHGRGSV